MHIIYSKVSIMVSKIKSLKVEYLENDETDFHLLKCFIEDGIRPKRIFIDNSHAERNPDTEVIKMYMYYPHAGYCKLDCIRSYHMKDFNGVERQIAQPHIILSPFETILDIQKELSSLELSKKPAMK